MHLSKPRSAERIFKEKTSEVQNSSDVAVQHLYLFVPSFAVTGSKMSGTLKLKKKLAVEEKVA